MTLQPDDASVDEFYWDVNGTRLGPAVRPGACRGADVRPTSRPASTATRACTRLGRIRNPCESLTTTETAPPAVITEASAIGPYENLTVAIGFAQGTFEPRDDSFGASPKAIGGAVAAAFAVLAMLAAAILLRIAGLAQPPRRGTIIAQYEPPEGVAPWSPPTSSATPRRA